MGKRLVMLGVLTALALPAWVPGAASAQEPIKWTECGSLFKGE
jgi:hypothetical protein